MFAELPLAFVMFATARRLVRVTVGTVLGLAGVPAAVPALWRIPLLANGIEEALPASLRPPVDVTTAGSPSS